MSVATARPDAKDDERCIRQILAGDDSAFNDLVGRYKDPLYELACRILNSRTEAEDVIQDAFLEAYRHLGDFHFRSRFSTWLYSIVLNRVRNRIRKSKILRWYSLDVRRATRDGYRPPEMPERSPTVENIAERRMELETIVDAVHDFPVRYQSIFILHYFHNLPLEEVARRLDRPLGTVKVYLHRARELLYRRLKTRASADRWRKKEALEPALIG